MEATQSLNITLLTRSLTRGGAQMQVATLARELHGRHSVYVATFYSGGALQRELEEHGVRVIELHKAGRWQLLRPLNRLVAHLKQTRCDVIYSFLPMENLLGLAASFRAATPIVWGIRGAGVHRAQFGLASRVLYGLQFLLIHRADAVISNSDAAANEIRGRSIRKLQVVPNGIDCGRFAPSAEARDRWRADHRIEPTARLVGIVARLDPMKDHRTFLQAAAEVAKRDATVSFIVAGDGNEAYRSSLRSEASRLGIGDRIAWLGEVADLVPIYNALDIVVSSSAYGEGFSNSIGEAMACGTLAVVTNIGDSAKIVGALGKVVPPNAPGELADAIFMALQEGVAGTRMTRHRWISDQFSVGRMAARTEAILRQTAARLQGSG